MLRADEVTGFHNVTKKGLNSALVSGFDLATAAGPLMDEPMQGAVFILENIAIDKEGAEEHKATE
jgi:translation elongation factor EF-G